MASPLPCPQEFQLHMNRTWMRLNECHVASLVQSTPASCAKCHHFAQRTLLLPLSLPVVICINCCLIRKITESTPHHLIVPLARDAALTGYLFICPIVIVESLLKYWQYKSQQYGLLEGLLFWPTRLLLRNHPHK